MKNKVIFLIIILFLFSVFNSCVSMKKGQHSDKFLSQFFNNESVYNSLKDYYSQKDIIIYDNKKELSDDAKTFGIDSKKIKIETKKPTNNNYFLVYSFILNENLSMLVLSTFDGDKGIIYYVRKKNKIETWEIMNIIPMNRY